MNETEIISGLKNNDQRVFDHLFDLYFSQVHYFSYKLTSDREEAKDIVIRAFQTLWNLRYNFESLANIKAFLYVTSRNNSFNYLEFKRRQEEGKEEYMSRLTQLEDSKTVDRIMIEAELLKTIYQEIENLPLKCREIFKLTYFEGLRAGEIAKRLKISTSTVTTQRSIAIKYLRQVLTDEKLLVLCLVLTEAPHLALVV